MAFSNAPIVSTYSSHRVPLVCDTIYRAATGGPSKYQGMMNILPVIEMENEEKKVYGETRYPIKADLITTSTQNQVRGMYVWEKTIGTVYYFVVIDNGTSSKVYTSTTGLLASWTAVTTLTNQGTTPVRFTEFIDSSTNTKSLIMVDGIEGYVFTSNAAGTKIVDADFPSPHVPFPIFLDGYLFLAKANTGDIYNSDLNTPSSWTAGNFISSEMYPDDIQALVRINNYILAIGTTGSEYFYDVGNSPGSPLARLDGASLPFGTLFPNTIASSLDSVVIFANTHDGESTFKYVEGLKHKSILGSFIPVVFNSILPNNPGVGWRGYFLRQRGSLFYVIDTWGVYSTVGGSLNAPTFAYSFDTEIWSELSYNNDSFPVNFSATATSLSNTNYVAGVYGGVAFFGKMQAASTASFGAVLDVISTSGTSRPIQERIDLGQVDFGTMNLKTMSRAALVYSSDYETLGATFDLILAYNDIDGASSLPYNQRMPASGGNTAGVGGFPFWNQLGVFRRRKMVIISGALLANNTSWPKVWKYLEVDINKMQQ